MNIEKLEWLDNLQLAGNRINDYNDVDKLGDLSRLKKLTLANNPITRKNMYRQVMIRKLPRLEILDGKAISQEELERVDQIFAQESKPQGIIVASSGQNIAGNHPLQAPLKVPMKINPVNFESVFGSLKIQGTMPAVPSQDVSLTSTVQSNQNSQIVLFVFC